MKGNPIERGLVLWRLSGTIQDRIIQERPTMVPSQTVWNAVPRDRLTSLCKTRWLIVFVPYNRQKNEVKAKRATQKLAKGKSKNEGKGERKGKEECMGLKIERRNKRTEGKCMGYSSLVIHI